MPNFTTLFLFPAAAAFLVSLIATRITIALYRRFNLLDHPTHSPHAKTVHQYPVPRGGGIPIIIALFVIGILWIGFDQRFLGILLGALILAIVGVLDDLYDLSPYLRLITGTLAALCVVASGIGIAFITNPFGPPGSIYHLNTPTLSFDFFGPRQIWILSDLFALIWILWTTNIVNWSKGIDGQMPGFVSIAALFLGLLSFRFAGDFTQWPVLYLAAIISGSYLGFLAFNRYPQQIMPGYGGGSLAGFLLAVLAILSGAKVAALILILGLPMADAFITIIRRLISGKSPVWGDRGHFHHRLLDTGWSKPSIARLYWAATVLLGILTLQLNSTQKIFTIAMTVLITGGIILSLQSINHRQS